jgi:hypothetical protein
VSCHGMKFGSFRWLLYAGCHVGRARKRAPNPRQVWFGTRGSSRSPRDSLDTVLVLQPKCC